MRSYGSFPTSGTGQYDSETNALIQLAFPLPAVFLLDSRHGVCRKVVIDDKSATIHF